VREAEVRAARRRAEEDTVERLQSESEFHALEPEWLALERTSGNTLPFRTYAWAAAWWRHMRESRLAVRDRLAIHTVRSARGRLVCVAPFLVTERPSNGPIRARCLHFVGADPNMTEVRGALCEAGAEEGSYRAIAVRVAQYHDIDWVHWTGIDTRSDIWSSPFAPSAVRWGDGVVCSIRALPPTFDELRASVSRNLKEALRRAHNRLKRGGLRISLEIARTRADVAPALDDFFRLHAARAELEGTVRHPDVFKHPACRAFLVDVCERLADRQALRIFRLCAGGSLVATRIGFVLGDTLFLYYSGFDPAYAEYGVMTAAVAEALKSAIAEGQRAVNFSTGRDVWKLGWRPIQVTYREALIFSPHFFGRAKYRALGVARRALTQTRIERLFARRA
jgi:CelD/BcsL family acetyltransferase involved in cellulose biosynthesis